VEVGGAAAGDDVGAAEVGAGVAGEPAGAFDGDEQPATANTPAVTTAANPTPLWRSAMSGTRVPNMRLSLLTQQSR
jgi:hypothetical protein